MARSPAGADISSSSPSSPSSSSSSSSPSPRRPLGALGSLGSLSARVRPPSPPNQQLLPLLPALEGILPGGLPRGATVEVAAGGDGRGAADGAAASWTIPAGGATTLAFSLLAAATRGGSWCAAVGVADVGVVALAEMGVDLDHLALVPRPGARWGEAAALLLEGMDAVLVCPPGPVRPALARRLAARARERRVALVVLTRRGRWPEGAERRLTVEAARWDGAGRGDGHLRGRRAEIVVGGRRAASRPVRTELWLPAASGAPVGSGAPAP